MYDHSDYNNDMTEKDNAVNAQKLTEPEKVVLAMNWPGYRYLRCEKHGVVAYPPTDKTSTCCPNQGCDGHMVSISDPVAYMKAHS